jgi:hypothetical protein
MSLIIESSSHQQIEIEVFPQPVRRGKPRLYTKVWRDYSFERSIAITSSGVITPVS